VGHWPTLLFSDASRIAAMNLFRFSGMESVIVYGMNLADSMVRYVLFLLCLLKEAAFREQNSSH
jgi:hypothetical protein